MKDQGTNHDRWAVGCWYPGGTMTPGANLLPGLEAGAFAQGHSAWGHSGPEPHGLPPWVEADC